jgi:hypothetical protein
MGTILPRIMDKQREVATTLAESEVNVGPITLDELLLTLKRKALTTKEHQSQMK